MYAPREDSFFMSETLKEYLKNKDKKIRILDLGTGCGIQAESCLSLGFKNILASDIEKEAVKQAANRKIKSVKSSLFEKVKGRFDLIIFNPPYLPKDKHDTKKDTTGGRLGDETIVKFLNQAKSYLSKNGDILLLLSSLTPRARIGKIIKENYKSVNLAEKKIFFEKLEVLLLSPLEA